MKESTVKESLTVQALKLALEALEWADCNDDDGYEDKKQKALTAIYQALADADAFTCRMRVGQDSVTWYDEKGNETMHVDSSNKVTVTKHESTNEPVGINGLTEAETSATASVMGLVNTTPPQRTWVGLTDDEVEIIYNAVDGNEFPMDFYKEIEAKLKEKNGYAEEKNQ